jgi:hypothetical protein
MQLKGAAMGNDSPTFVKLDQRLEAEPLVVGAHTLRLVARLSGWHTPVQGEAAALTSETPVPPEFATSGGAAAVRLAPLEVNVEDDDGIYQVPLIDPTREVIGGMAKGAAAIAALCILIMVAARLLARR